MSVSEPVTTSIEVNVNNVGGIDNTTISFSPGGRQSHKGYWFQTPGPAFARRACGPARPGLGGVGSRYAELLSAAARNPGLCLLTTTEDPGTSP